ncbi:hypothetical protein SCARR_05576 [Pontiella sulfatireligans]|uniref:Uncharacterized protein n=1 Tax=Pontiella sulfatireligans TaxID=2750658 RepID=A0A6C2UTH6_9BACT|nr:hypothetical protein SCARR_05576 [Pontiella sulfatireligans]
MILGVILGLLVTVTHFALLRGLSELVSTALGPIARRMMIKQGNEPSFWDKGHQYLTYAQVVVQFLLAFTGLIFWFFFPAIWSSWAHAWSSPIPCLIYLLLAVLLLHKTLSGIPLVRQVIFFYRFSAVPVSILLLLIFYVPSVRTAVPYTYGLLVAYCCLVLSTVFGIWYNTRKWSNFAELNHRHDLIVEKFPKLQRLILVLIRNPRDHAGSSTKLSRSVGGVSHHVQTWGL